MKYGKDKEEERTQDLNYEFLHRILHIFNQTESHLSKLQFLDIQKDFSMPKTIIITMVMIKLHANLIGMILEIRDISAIKV